MWAWGMSTKGVIQLVSGGGGRAFLGRGAVRGTQRAAGQLGDAHGRVGAGRVSGGVVVELRRTRRSWPRGRWRFRKTGWSESIAPTTRASWRRYAAASSAGGRQGATEWQKRIAKRLGLESAYRSPGRPGISGGTRRPATRNGPCLLTSIANIGPVPFSVFSVKRPDRRGLSVEALKTWTPSRLRHTIQRECDGRIASVLRGRGS